jgi:dienelactone hydrolase
MRKTFRVLAAVLLPLVLQVHPLCAQGEFWGELKAGPYGVGFRALYQSDPARSYDPDYPSPGAPAAKKPRPIFVAVWYPAPPGQGKSMLHRDYFRVMTLDPGAPDFAQRLRTFTRDQACLYMIGKEFEALSEEERARWDGLLSTPVVAVLNSPAAPGRFPVVIYHPGLGGTFEDNAVACEYLASHGYVVLSSAYQSADSTSLNIDGDFETSLADLSFLLRFAATLPFADAEKAGAIGHSYGAQAVLGWRAQPGSPLDAAVALAPSFATEGLERNPKSAAPVILFADRTRHPRFEAFEPYLKFAPRYEAGTPALEDTAFVSQGAIGKDDPARRSYEAVCALTLDFLDAHLRGSSDALQRLRAADSAGPLHLRYRQPAPLPPTGAQIVRLYRAEGPANPQALTALLKSAEPGAVLGAASILSAGAEKKQAADLLKSAARLHPRSAVLHRALGDALQQTGDSEGASAAYEKALALLPADDSLTAEQKDDLRRSIEASRKK